MQVLIATARTQGARGNDFCWTMDGELVFFGFVCDSATTDDHCGCARSWTGMESHKGTTTAVVVDRDITRDAVAVVLRASLVGAGWYEDGAPIPDLDASVDHLLEIAAWAGLGQVLEIRPGGVQIRA